MLSSLKPANGKFVLGPPVETTPPVVVYTGTPENPDSAAQAVSAAPVKKKKTKTAKATTEKPAAAGDKPKAADKKPAEKPKAAKPATSAKPKVSSATQ
jgi:hypothetical protein